MLGVWPFAEETYWPLLYSYENIATYSTMYELDKYNAGWKKLNKKECISYGFIYTSKITKYNWTLLCISAEKY